MQIVTHGTITAEVKARIQVEVSGQQNLKDMMAWALSQGSGFQDEFTHDLIVPRSDGLVLVYDTT